MMATGGVGGYVGAKLVEAGIDVTMMARGAHLEAIRRDGLVVNTPDRRIVARPALATDDPKEVGPVDYVVFAVKLQDTESAAEFIRPMIGPETAVVPFQNGVDAVETLTRVLGPKPVMMGTCYISSNISAPGEITQTGSFARFVFGEPDGGQSERSNRLREVFVGAKLEAPQPRDVRVDVWRKFAFLSSMSGITASARVPIGVVRSDPAMREVLRRAVAETTAVARALGVALPEDSVEAHMKMVEGLPADMLASQAHDLFAGKPLELEGLSGAVVRLGKQVGVDTPVHETFHAVLRPYVNGKGTA
jgi:2-dehydropantoate 2-reductase